MPNSRPPMLWSLHGRALQRMRSRLEPRGHRIRYGGSGVCQCGSSHFSCDTHIVGSASLVICQGWGRGLFVIPLTLLIWFLTFLGGGGGHRPSLEVIKAAPPLLPDSLSPPPVHTQVDADMLYSVLLTLCWISLTSQAFSQLMFNKLVYSTRTHH